MLLIRPLTFALLLVTGTVAGKTSTTTTTTTTTTTKATTTSATTTTSTAPTPVSSQVNYCGNGITSYCCSTDGSGASQCAAMGPASICSTTVVCCNSNDSVDICIGSVSGTVNVYVNISEIIQGGDCCCGGPGSPPGPPGHPGNGHGYGGKW